MGIGELGRGQWGSHGQDIEIGLYGTRIDYDLVSHGEQPRGAQEFLVAVRRGIWRRVGWARGHGAGAGRQSWAGFAGVGRNEVALTILWYPMGSGRELVGGSWWQDVQGFTVGQGVGLVGHSFGTEEERHDSGEFRLCGTARGC